MKRTDLLLRRPRNFGFTLVELVVAITVGAIVVGMSVALMSTPVDAYMAQSRRAELVQDADRVSRWMLQDTQEDVLPNSVRILTTANTRVLQFIKTSGFAFYAPGTSTPEELDFSPAGDNLFHAYGRFPNGVQAGWRLSINNPGTGLADAYLANSSTPAVLAGVNNNADKVQLNPPFWFRNGPSAWNRVYVIREPVTYICDLGAGTLRRFNNHALAATIPSNAADAQLNSAGTVARTLATAITACTISCASFFNGVCQRSVKFDITLSRATAPQESMRVFQELPVDNSP
jgi:MSHA biogenesis protein MshO